MPRYALLRHDCPAEYRTGPHWDLMLQRGDVLCTWELRELPNSWAKAIGAPIASTDEVSVTQLGEHRIEYLEYEGPVSGNRGTVERVAEGTFQWTGANAWQFESGPLEGNAAVVDGVLCGNAP